jgi:hypothetical protein
MNRRGFLSALIGTGLSAAIDPERLLWEPGKKLISIPPPKLTPIIATPWPPFKIGDTITIAGRYAVNPFTREATDQLQNFKVIEISPSGERARLIPVPSIAIHKAVILG